MAPAPFSVRSLQLLEGGTTKQLAAVTAVTVSSEEGFRQKEDDSWNLAEPGDHRRNSTKRHPSNKFYVSGSQSGLEEKTRTL